MANILVISSIPSHPQDIGNRARVFSLLSGLQKAGHQVHLAYIRMNEADESAMAACWDGFYCLPYRKPPRRLFKRIYDRLARDLGSVKVLPFLVDDWFEANLTVQIEALRNRIRPDVVMVEYVYLSKALECFGPETLKILDTHDVFADRHKMYIKRGLAPVYFYTSPAEELRGLRRADVVLAIQKEEADYFSGKISSRVLTVGHTSLPQNMASECNDESPRLLFVGSCNQINVDAINWFIDEAFPLVREIVPEVSLDVVGGCAELLSATEQVNLVGRVDDLPPCYERATIVLNPLRFGTGLKIKTIEALSMPRPLVTTSVGAAGLDDWRDRAFLVADSPQQFAEAIVKLLQFRAHREQLCQGAKQFTNTYNQAAIEPLLGVLRKYRK